MKSSLEDYEGKIGIRVLRIVQGPIRIEVYTLR